MFPRNSFWLGLLLGGLASFNTRSYWLPQSAVKPAEPLLDMVGEAVVVCDADGVITYTNAAAQTLLGPNGKGISRLLYPSGQKVPDGQLPLNRARRTHKEVTGAGYILVSDDGATRALEIFSKPHFNGGAAATIRDVTALQQGQARETVVNSREQTLRDLCRRMSAAQNAASLARAVAESASALARPRTDVQVRLYTYDSGSKLLTRLASIPEERSIRGQNPSVTFPFDAQSPLQWSVYVSRQPILAVAETRSAWNALGEEGEGAAYALPLAAGGVAFGHLSLTCPAPDSLADEGLHDSLALLASVAALALAGPQQAAQSAHLAEQVLALREIVQAVGRQKNSAELADLVSRHVVSVLGAEVCTIALRDGRRLHLAGTNYQDALLFPDRYAPNDQTLLDAVTWEALNTGQTKQHNGLANPRFEEGVWRAFAGQSGKHSVLAVPLGADLGVLTVYAAGETLFPAGQITFVETVASLLSAASLSAGRADA